MNIRIFRIDLKETNRLLERIAKALEAQVEIPAVPPLPKQKIKATDVQTYLGEEETAGGVLERLRQAGASEAEIEKVLLHLYDEEEVAD